MSGNPSNSAAAQDERPYRQRFSVQFDYPVHFTRGLFRRDNPVFAAVVDRLGEGRRHRVAVYVDGGLAEADVAELCTLHQAASRGQSGLPPCDPTASDPRERA